MVDFESKLSKIETEVAAMREKISFFSVIYEKFDRTLDKLETKDRRPKQVALDCNWWRCCCWLDFISSGVAFRDQIVYND